MAHLASADYGNKLAFIGHDLTSAVTTGQPADLFFSFFTTVILVYPVCPLACPHDVPLVDLKGVMLIVALPPISYNVQLEQA